MYTHNMLFLCLGVNESFLPSVQYCKDDDGQNEVRMCGRMNVDMRADMGRRCKTVRLSITTLPPPILSLAF